MARGDPNIQGLYSGGLPSGGYRQPNVQPYMGGILAARYGGGGAYGSSQGYGGADPRKKKMDELLSARKPGLDPIADPALAELGQTGPGGEYDPEKLYGVRERPGNRTSMEDYLARSSALGRWRGRPGAVGGVAQGAGFENPYDLFKKLIMQRLGGGF